MDALRRSGSASQGIIELHVFAESKSRKTNITADDDICENGGSADIRRNIEKKNQVNWRAQQKGLFIFYRERQNK